MCYAWPVYINWSSVRQEKIIYAFSLFWRVIIGKI